MGNKFVGTIKQWDIFLKGNFIAGIVCRSVRKHLKNIRSFDAIMGWKLWDLAELETRKY